MKEQKKLIFTRQESRFAYIALRTDWNSSRPDVLYFLHTAHFLKQLPTHIAHIGKAPHANAEKQSFVKEFNFAIFVESFNSY